jgi:hypothetical protein
MPNRMRVFSLSLIGKTKHKKMMMFAFIRGIIYQKCGHFSILMAA